MGEEKVRKAPLKHRYPEGAKFRVVKPGAYLSGMRPIAPSAFQGARIDLAVGDVIEVSRVAPGWGSDPGPPIVQWKADMNFPEFRPQVGSFWFPEPDDTYLERVE